VNELVFSPALWGTYHVSEQSEGLGRRSDGAALFANMRTAQGAEGTTPPMHLRHCFASLSRSWFQDMCITGPLCQSRLHCRP